jgi:hypothetical protein
MQNVRPWQMVLFVIAALALGATVVRGLLADRPNLSHELKLADIRTGELFSLDSSGRSIPVPACNPATGERNLFPVAKNDAGAWVVDARALQQIQATRPEQAEGLNLESGLVIEPGDVKRIRPRDLIKR